jgi:dihydrofolate reductase
MKIIIAAAGENNELGKDNQLVWHLPDDFKRFKKITTGHYIIMGRKTFESFPAPLPNRTHVVISRNKNFKAEGCIIVDSLESAFKTCENETTVFIIGGGEIYKQSISFADKIELTRVHYTFNADTFFPEINSSTWECIQKEFHSADEKHAFSFTYETYIKKHPDKIGML